VIGQDRHAGCYVVRLDVPAIFHWADGGVEDVPEIVEAIDNIIDLDSAGLSSPTALERLMR
jgi:hypothetical protein